MYRKDKLRRQRAEDAARAERKQLRRELEEQLQDVQRAIAAQQGLLQQLQGMVRTELVLRQMHWKEEQLRELYSTERGIERRLCRV